MLILCFLLLTVEYASTASSSNCPPPKPKGSIAIDVSDEEGSEGDEDGDSEEDGSDQSNNSASS